MKSISELLTLFAFLGAAMGTQAAPVLFPNGDFATAAGAQWGISPANGNFAFPAAGGNPDGYAEMGSSQPGGYAVLISNNDAPYPIASLGLVAGKAYNFTYDMITSVAGSNKGGVKIESWTATNVISDSGDQRKTSVTTGWASYTQQYTIAAGATHIKIVPLWTPGETVGFDNIAVNNTPVTVVPVVPNGDFEASPNHGLNWAFFQGGGQTVNYPATGGNPNGCAVIDSVGKGAFAVMVWNNNAPLPLSSLGLTAGQTYTFSQDMKILAPSVGTPGRSIGGIKVDFIPGSTGDIYPSQLIGDGTTWQTYTFQITIPNGCTQINLVPLWGPNSQVAYDNFKIILPTPPAPPQPSIIIGSVLNWTPTVAVNFYQPQESVDNSVWTNLGSSYLGTAVSSIFDPTPSAFYRVEEAAPVVQEAAINGSFEDELFGAPDGWALVQSQPPTLAATDAHTGTNSINIKVTNLITGAGANGSELQQNVTNAGGSITAGKTYNFSFWAKQVSSGPSYIEQFRVTWLNGGGGEVGTGGFQNFSGTVGVWEKKTQNGLVAPAGAASALIQILGVTGAVDGGFGEVIIDDVSLQSTAAGTPNTIASSSASAAEVSWKSVTGQSYQVQSSTDLSGWSPFGGAITGDNSVKAVYDTPLVTEKFYQLGTQ